MKSKEKIICIHKIVYAVLWNIIFYGNLARKQAFDGLMYAYLLAAVLSLIEAVLRIRQYRKNRR